MRRGLVDRVYESVPHPKMDERENEEINDAFEPQWPNLVGGAGPGGEEPFEPRRLHSPHERNVQDFA